jgi:hypothetical protein
MAKFAGVRDPVTQDFEHSAWAYCVDALSIALGALLGTPPVTAFIESATGIAEGGRTGLAAVVTGLAFLASVFFAPVFASIPSWATGGALVVVGSLMIRKCVFAMYGRGGGLLKRIVASATSTGTTWATPCPPSSRSSSFHSVRRLNLSLRTF